MQIGICTLMHNGVHKGDDGFNGDNGDDEFCAMGTMSSVHKLLELALHNGDDEFCASKGK